MKSLTLTMGIAMAIGAIWTTPRQALAEPMAPQGTRTLAEVLRAARGFELDLALAEQEVRIARASRDTQAGGLWPRLEARLSYTRNQHDAQVVLPDGEQSRIITITPHDQLEANATITVPILDLGLRARLDAADTRIGGLDAQKNERAQALDERVATAYFQVALAQSRRQIAEGEVRLVSQRIHELSVRKQAGFENPLALENAHADLERARREVSAADYELGMARLELESASGLSDVVATLSGLSPAPGGEVLRARVESLPAVKAAMADAEAFRQEADASRLDLVPTLEAFVADRLTNAVGFGEVNNLSVGIAARFALDAPTLRRRDEALARARSAGLRAMVARRDGELKLRRLALEADHRQAALAAASAEVTAREAAAKEAALRVQSGLATPLELRTAERDRQSAWLELARAQAEAALTQALLIIAAGGTP